MSATPLPLKPMHLPPDVGLWPLAPGWWILLALLLSGLFLGWRAWRRRQRRQAPNRWLRHQLEALFEQQLDAHATAQACNRLLKRWALSQGAAPGLQGKPWLAFLQQHSPQPLEQSVGLFLTEQAYQTKPLLDAAALKDIEASLMRFARTAHSREFTGV
ncbi:DUF4381 domain-containing protein [Simiduia agarivorans]|uniref:DUF4381 domain-containing protein n=1 Tax=Simiduia agarivorans (strain DSM 21679 / JCM 13881 / BCRC 17597 / SA1) TaxID=1117647 RepID=K4KHJ8_SIMAS|nr:DUF4381 domain-containing protein [Simiduia agarivorans]AFU97438.1 hypothetical protein M5M_01025 [Simiduia agarivorans SA1 = DSM 21679]